MKDKAIKAAMNSIENRICHVYNQGYEDGFICGKQSVQIDETTAYGAGYGAGLEAAWGLARKLSDLGFDDTRKEIFGEKYGLSIDIIKDFSVDEVEAKIEEYEKKQKQAEKIKEYFEPVEGKPGYVWLSNRHLNIVSMEALEKWLKLDE